MDSDSLLKKLEQNEKIINILGGVSNVVPDLYVNSDDFSENISPLLKLYAKQLMVLKDFSHADSLHNGKQALKDLLKRYPSLKSWLKCLNISDNSMNIITTHVDTFHELYEKDDRMLKYYLDNLNILKQETNVICAAFSYLKIHYQKMEKSPSPSTSELCTLNEAKPPPVPDRKPIQIIYQQTTKSQSSNHILNQQHNNLTVPSNINTVHLPPSSSSSALHSMCNDSVLKINQQRKSESDIVHNLVNLQSNKTQVTTTSNFLKNNINTNVKQNKKISKVSTPPPSRKNSTSNILNINLNSQTTSHTCQQQQATIASPTPIQPTANLSPMVSPTNMQRSSSYDSQTRNKIEQLTHHPTQDLLVAYQKNQRRQSTEGSDCSGSHVPSGQTSPIHTSSPIKYSHSNKSSNLSIPRSSKHSDQSGQHSWCKIFKVTNCNVCHKRMVFGIKCKICKFFKYIRIKNVKKCSVCFKPVWNGQKCKYCKIRCHKDCEKSCDPNCPILLLPTHSKAIVNGHQINTANPISSNGNNSQQNKNYSCESSSNASSCNSSGPNSPNHIKLPNSKYNTMQFPLTTSSSISNQLNETPQQQYYPILAQSTSATQSSSSNLTTPHSLKPKAEFFPSTHDQTNDTDQIAQSLRDNLKLAIEKKNNLNDTNEENQNEGYTNADLNDSLDYDVHQTASFAQSLKDGFVQINYEEITIKEELGRGRFGKVYKAYWHGPHAVKEIDFDENLSETSEQLKHFKQEVLNLCKTRHSNLILFVGACLKPPKLAIVMSVCRGITLYKYLHMDTSTNTAKQNFDWIIHVAIQIAQGMGYLHAKGLLHKDLKSKNIFIDGNKAVISDFGLFSVSKLCKKPKRNDLLQITKECLYYLAPELIRCLANNDTDLPFSQESDVFAFGTVWYELFCYEFPYSSYDAHTIIYLCGNGQISFLPSLQIAKELKNVLLRCWSKDPSLRPSFYALLEIFRAVPKRKLYRSPSHPTTIGRSLEAINMNDMKKT